jgi:hypothetical protein
MIPQYKNIKMFYPEQHAYTFDQYRWVKWRRSSQQGMCCGSSRAGCLLQQSDYALQGRAGIWAALQCQQLPQYSLALKAPCVWAGSSSAPITALTAL